MKILIVDEDEGIRKAISRMLRLMKVSDTDDAWNGKEALTLCKYKEYDLVLTDFDMPIMNGVDFICGLAEDLELPERERLYLQPHKIIMISGNYDIAKVLPPEVTFFKKRNLLELKEALEKIVKDSQ